MFDVSDVSIWDLGSWLPAFLQPRSDDGVPYPSNTEIRNAYIIADTFFSELRAFDSVISTNFAHRKDARQALDKVMEFLCVDERGQTPDVFLDDWQNNRLHLFFDDDRDYYSTEGRKVMGNILRVFSDRKRWRLMFGYIHRYCLPSEHKVTEQDISETVEYMNDWLKEKPEELYVEKPEGPYPA